MKSPCSRRVASSLALAASVSTEARAATDTAQTDSTETPVEGG